MQGEYFLKFLLAVLFTFLINIPFGYWRAKLKRLSKEWFLAVHLPVPFIVTCRLLLGIHLSVFTVLFLVTAFFLGQRFGILLNKYFERKLGETSKNLFADVLRLKGSYAQRGEQNKEVHQGFDKE